MSVYRKSEPRSLEGWNIPSTSTASDLLYLQYLKYKQYDGYEDDKYERRESEYLFMDGSQLYLAELFYNDHGEIIKEFLFRVGDFPYAEFAITIAQFVDADAMSDAMQMLCPMRCMI